MAMNENKPPRRPLALDLGSEGCRRVVGGFLGAVRIKRPRGAKEFPFNIPAIRATKRVELHPAITFFIGENGSGKSTLLEAIAVKARFNAQGGVKCGATETLASDSGLEHSLTLERSGSPREGWFLRAESFYNIATEREDLDKEPLCGHGFAASGGKSLHAQSHGEAFFALLTNRLQGGGLYLFDEPEAARSPQRPARRPQAAPSVRLSPQPAHHRHAFADPPGVSARADF